MLRVLLAPLVRIRPNTILEPAQQPSPPTQPVLAQLSLQGTRSQFDAPTSAHRRFEVNAGESSA
jgi:hypothetical protein